VCVSFCYHSISLVFFFSKISTVVYFVFVCGENWYMIMITGLKRKLFNMFSTFSWCCSTATRLILTSKTIANRKKIPFSTLIHFPNITFLSSMFCIGFIKKMGKKKHIICKIMFSSCMSLESMRFFIKIFLTNTTNETFWFECWFNWIELFSKITKCIDDKTLNDSK